MIMSVEAWGLFLGACFLLNVAPGPDLIFILSRTIAHGRKVGLFASLGVCTGAMVHVVAAALGVSAILATSALAFSVLKYVGAAYLLWLGVKSLLTRTGSLQFDGKEGRPLSAMAAYRQGILIDVLNPKPALFFMAFLPQFIAHDGSISSHEILVQTLVLGSIVILMGLVVETVYILVASAMRNYLRSNTRLTLWLDRVFGGLLIGLGAKLAISE